jgi:hypothetical protein
MGSGSTEGTAAEGNTSIPMSNSLFSWWRGCCSKSTTSEHIELPNGGDISMDNLFDKHASKPDEHGPLDISVLLEGIRKGRVLRANLLQVLYVKK